MIGKLGGSWSLPPLLSALQDGYTDWNGHKPIRNEAAKALGELGDVAALPHLLDTLKDTNWRVRATAAAALDNFNWAVRLPIMLTYIAEKHVQDYFKHAAIQMETPLWVDEAVNKLCFIEQNKKQQMTITPAESIHLHQLSTRSSTKTNHCIIA